MIWQRFTILLKVHSTAPAQGIFSFWAFEKRRSLSIGALRREKISTRRGKRCGSDKVTALDHKLTQQCVQRQSAFSSAERDDGRPGLAILAVKGAEEDEESS